MTDPEVLINALKSVAVKASIDPANWNVGLQADAAVRAVLSEIDRRGWQCMPKHPTRAMQAACCVLTDADGEWKPETHQNEFWKAMVAAAPKLGGK